MNNLDFNALTPEQQEQLMKQAEEKLKGKKKQQQEERGKYKEMVDAEVRKLLPGLEAASKELGRQKQLVFDTLGTFIKMKSELYDREDDQWSHSFSTTDGMITITMGHNVTDGWDDTVNTGIAKVNDYLKSLVKDKESKNLVDTILKLLSKDSKGNLKASRIMQLKQLADKSDNKAFIDAIEIIQDAYKPIKSKEFVRVIVKDSAGSNEALPLSITDAPFPSAEEV